MNDWLPGGARFTALLLLALIICIPLPWLAPVCGADNRVPPLYLLTPEEKAWLAGHPVIRLAPESSYAPFIFLDNDGKLKGISIDYLGLLEKRLGIKFQTMAADNLSSILERARRGQVDVITSLSKTPERAEYLLFTKPYIRVPTALIVRRDFTGAKTIELMKGNKIAFGKGFGVGSYLQNHARVLQLVPVADDATALHMVSFGEVDAAVVDLASATSVIETHKISNLRVASTFDFAYELSFASRKDWPILNRILEKGVSRISPDEREAIYNKWVRLSEASHFSGRVFWIFVSVLAGILILSATAANIWNRTLRRRIHQKTIELRTELTERQRVEESLQRSREMYRLLVENQTDLVVKFDPQWRFQFVSPSYCELFDRAEAELLGQPCSHQIHEDDRAATAQAMEGLFRHPFFCHLEQRVLTKCGWRWLSWRYRAILNATGEVEAIVAGGRDISDRKNAEESLRKSEELYRLTLSSFSDAVCITDEHGAFVFVCPNIDVIFGFSSEEVLGMGKIASLLGVDPATGHALGIDAEIRNFEQEAVDKYGRKHHLLVSVKGVSIQAGKRLYTCRDISERKKAEDLLKENLLFRREAEKIARIGAWMASPDTDYLYWTEGIYEILEAPIEFKPGFAEGLRFYDDDFIPVLHEAIQRVLRDGTSFVVDAQLTTMRGKHIWCEVRGLGRMEKDGHTHVIGTFQDITERRQMVESLREREELFSNIVGQAADAIALADKAGSFVEFNTAAHEGLGYTREEFADLSLSDIQAEHSPEIIHQYIGQTVSQGKMAFETQHRCRSGEIRDVRVSIKPICIRGQDFLATVWTDITERTQAERAVRRSEARLRTLIERSPIAMALVDQEGGTSFLNERFSEILGYTREDLPTLTQWWPIAFPDAEYRSRTIENWQAAVDKAAQGNGIIEPSEYQVTCKDGMIRVMEISELILEGEFLACFIDLTARIRAEEDLLFHKTILEETGHIARVGGWLFNAVTGEGFWTDEVARLHGVDPSLPTSLSSGLGYYTDESRKIIEAAIRDAVEKGTSYDLELEMNSAQGEHKWVRTIGHPIAEGGKVLRIQGSFQDITEQKIAQEDRKKLHTQLLQAQKMEAIGQLAGGVAHDFNNLLTAIIGCSQLILSKVPADSPVSHFAEMIYDAGESAAVLTQSLLAFSRKQILNTKAVDICEIVKGFEKMLRRIIKENIDFITAVPENALVAMADKGQIEQVLMNFVTNANDAMPHGGTLQITVSRFFMDETYVSAHGYGAVGGYALLSVTDTGCGMDKETQKKIFEPFFTTKEVGKGTGLGLAIIYGIIKQHNGYINCYSELGKGTTFRVYLPLMVLEKKEEADSIETTPLPRGKETILLVEDDEIVRKMHRIILEDAGYTVITAKDGDEALVKFEQHSASIQLLATDVIMPKRNGHSVYLKIKQVDPDMKVVFLSGYTKDVVLQSGILDGVYDFIQKPVKPGDLLRKVRSIIDR